MPDMVCEIAARVREEPNRNHALSMLSTFNVYDAGKHQDGEDFKIIKQWVELQNLKTIRGTLVSGFRSLHSLIFETETSSSEYYVP